MSGPGPGREPDDFDRLRRRVLWAMPTGLYVIGSRAGSGPAVRRNLMTANLVVQVSVEPKQVGVAIDASSVTRRLVDEGGVFTVSLLGRDERAVIRRFVKPVTDVETDAGGRATAMAGLAVAEAPSGAPVLAGAVAWLDCEVRQRLDAGSHLFVVGEVVGVDGPDGAMPPVLRMEDTRMNYGG
ncbi:MAG: flavin reductase family protein [Acidimicrobiales bacterium]